MESELDESELISRAANGDTAAIGQLLSRHELRLKRMISIRMDSRLKGRLDASDVFQELQLEASQRFEEFARQSTLPFFVWMRFLAKQKVAEACRRHLYTQARDVRREQAEFGSDGESTSVSLASFLMGQITSPSMQVAKAEIRQLVLSAIDSLDPLDREILLMRHAEQLSSSETANELNISQNTCRQRHVRALKRLKVLLSQHDLSWG
ncbi:MAG: sigma-70 family RNA polymerase sigma factor [Planctomycetales bacterium]|nr:sigma-70 family RNA polymerase sigma factor [Planctomycetales bacterium]MCA9169077.1 sigma-70 family RNA polymerase sigma factor [Planctomycetales bacterium]